MRSAKWAMAIVGVILLLPTAAQAASDVLFEPQGILGESQDDRHPNAIEVLSFSTGVTNAAGKPRTAEQSDVTITKFVDRSSPVILQNVASGQIVPTARLIVRKAGEAQLEFLRYCFTNVRFTSARTAASQTDTRLLESVSFTYDTLVERYQMQDARGGGGDVFFGGWDFVHNLQFGNPAC